MIALTNTATIDTLSDEICNSYLDGYEIEHVELQVSRNVVGFLKLLWAAEVNLNYRHLYTIATSICIRRIKPHIMIFIINDQQ